MKNEGYKECRDYEGLGLYKCDGMMEERGEGGNRNPNMKVLNPQNSVPRLEWHLPHFIFIAFRILFIRKKMFG